MSRGTSGRKSAPRPPVIFSTAAPRKRSRNGGHLTRGWARPHGVAKGTNDPGRHHVQHRPVRHVRLGKGQPHVEPVPLTTRNQVDVKVIHILTRRRPARNDHVHPLGPRHLSNGRRELHRHFEQVRPQPLGKVEKRLDVLPRYDKNVACVHRLDVHERDGFSVFVAHRNLGRPFDYVAEDAVSVCWGAHRASYSITDCGLRIAWKTFGAAHTPPRGYSFAIRIPQSVIPLLSWSTWQLKRARSVRRAPNSVPSNSLRHTAPCISRAGSTTRRSSSSGRTGSSSRSPAPDTRRSSPRPGWSRGRRMTGSTCTTATAPSVSSWGCRRRRCSIPPWAPRSIRTPVGARCPATGGKRSSTLSRPPPPPERSSSRPSGQRKLSFAPRR